MWNAKKKHIFCRFECCSFVLMPCKRLDNGSRTCDLSELKFTWVLSNKIRRSNRNRTLRSRIDKMTIRIWGYRSHSHPTSIRYTEYWLRNKWIFYRINFQIESINNLCSSTWWIAYNFCWLMRCAPIFLITERFQKTITCVKYNPFNWICSIFNSNQVIEMKITTFSLSIIEIECCECIACNQIQTNH